MKKTLTILIILICVEFGFSQNKISLADNGGNGCLSAYNVQYNEFVYQFQNDLFDCGMGMMMDWIGTFAGEPDPLNALSAIMNSDCGWSALNRLNTNLDNAAEAFVACSGLVIHP